MFTRPDWVRRINAMAGDAGGAAELVPIDADDLVGRAMRTTGLDDLGPDTWEEPFRRLVAALDEEAQLNVVGRLQTRHDLLCHLRIRLQLIDAQRRDPSLTGEPVTAPVVITGPARSGTSILHELLDTDPNLRAPRAWEMTQPFAPEGTPPEQRRAWAEASFDLWSDVQPEFAAVHELAAVLPEECLWLMTPEFAMGFWATCTSVPSFLAWRAMTDPLPGYRMHRSMLQLMTRTVEDPTPGQPWVLKSPVHLGRLPALFAVYPDARVIHTHRDPAKVVPSAVSTVATGRWLRSDAVDLADVAATTGFGMGMLLEVTAQQRAGDDVPSDQVTDLHYLDLLRDPVAAIEGAYDRLGLPFADGFADRIGAYLAARPQDKHGVHRYSAVDMGLDAATIRADFAAYLETSGVELEDLS